MQLNLKNIHQIMEDQRKEIVNLKQRLKGMLSYNLPLLWIKIPFDISITVQEDLVVTHKEIELTLKEQTSFQATALQEGKKLEEAQVSWIQEPEVEMTAKDNVLGQVLEVAKKSHGELDKELEATKKCQAETRRSKHPRMPK